MEARKTNEMVLLQELAKKLDFDRFNVHVDGKKVKAIVEEAHQILSAQEANEYDQDLIKELTLRLAIYYAFFKRDPELAAQYAKSYKEKVEKNTIEYADACGLLGYAYTIDPTFRDDSLYREAIAIYEKEENLHTKINIAFNQQYIGLMFHRNAIEADKAKNIALADERTKDALLYIGYAINGQEKLLDIFPNIRIGLAESLHICGAMNIRRYNNTKTFYFLNEADRFLEEAENCEEIFEKETGARHFLTSITYQSRGKTLGLLNRIPEGLAKFDAALERQVDHFGTEFHPDVPKTPQFKAELLMENKQYTEAFDALLWAWRIKKQVKYRDDFILKVTENSLEKVLGELKIILTPEDLNKTYLLLFQTAVLLGEFDCAFIQKMRKQHEAMGYQKMTLKDPNRFQFASEAQIAENVVDKKMQNEDKDEVLPRPKTN